VSWKLETLQAFLASDISFTAGIASALSRHPRITCVKMPEVARLLAMAFPMPLFAPVTTATLIISLVNADVWRNRQSELRITEVNLLTILI
jgi:hypothetical protein